MATIPEIAPYKGDGTTPLLQKWLDILWKWIRHVSSLGKVIDLTSATSDYALSVNETAKITISAASTPLNIAVGDGWYEIRMEFTASTFAADQAIRLDINNQQYAAQILYIATVASTAFATDETDTISATSSGHRFSSDYPVELEHAEGSLIINSTKSKLFSRASGLTGAGVNYLFSTSSVFDNGVAHTSLGTLQVGEACTGVVYVKRIA